MDGIDAIDFQHGHSGSVTYGFNYLRSPKGLYFGQLRDDGNFVVYRGASPDDRHDELWSTDSAKLPAGSGGLALMPMWQVGRGTTEVHLQIVADRLEDGHQVYHDLWESNSFTLQNSERARALVEDDGNFTVYKLTDDVTNPKLWQSGVTDPVVDYEITKLDFDIKAAKITNSLDSSIDSGSAENRSDSKDVTLEISGTVATSITSSWSDSLAIKVGVKSTYKTGVPLVGETGVEISLEVQNTYTWGGSTQDSKSFTWKVSPKAGPWERAKAVVYCTTSKIEVPYTLSGELIFKSGKRVAKKIAGIYAGSNSHSVRAIYTLEKIDHLSLDTVKPEPIAVAMNYRAS